MLPLRTLQPADQRAEYWSWLSVGLFLLLTVDLLTTFAVAAQVGLFAEVNPIIAVHLSVLIVGVFSFAGVLSILDRTTGAHRQSLSLLVECWLGLLIAAGLFMFANNLAVVVLERSLF